MSISLDDLRNFIVVSKTLNITRASEIAGLTQPTLSYSIKRLEKDLGAPLLIRLKNGVQLTKLGEEFKLKAEKLVFDWSSIQKLVDSEDGEIRGNYSLGMHPSVALYTLEYFLPSLAKEHPKIEFQLTHALSREITEKVINWELDFGIVVNPKRHPDLVIKELCEDKVSIFKKKSKDTSTTLIYDENLKQSGDILKKITRAKIKIDRHLTSANLEVVAKLASIGHGLAILPGRVAAKYSNLTNSHPSISFKDKICLIYRVEKHKDAAGKSVITHIQNAKY